jgi:hypothetical protein
MLRASRAWAQAVHAAGLVAMMMHAGGIVELTAALPRHRHTAVDASSE